MTRRTNKTTVTFKFPFVLDGFDQELPPGDYLLETEDELIEGISFPVYRRSSTVLYIHPKPGMTQMLVLSSADLSAAQSRDAVAAKAVIDAETGQPADTPILVEFTNENTTPSKTCSSTPQMPETRSSTNKS